MERVNTACGPDTPVLEIPSRALVVLVGTSGSGKSSFAARLFRPTEVLSSDRFRAMIADDEADQSVSVRAFEVLYAVARHRLETGRLAAVDATNVTAEARGGLLAVARASGAPAVAILLDLPLEDCVRNDAARPGRSVGRDVIAAQAEALRNSRGALDAEGFARVYVLNGRDEIDRARIVRV